MAYLENFDLDVNDEFPTATSKNEPALHQAIASIPPRLSLPVFLVKECHTNVNIIDTEKSQTPLVKA
jgi:hypothetical protein